MEQVYVYGADDVRLTAVPTPEAGADDVIVAVRACGICGSDLAYIAMGGLMGPSGQPMPLGHELSGQILQMGSNVKGFHVGQRVVVNPLAADNNIGNGGSEGGFTQQLLVRNVDRGACLLPLSDAITDEQGALVEPLSVGMHAVNQSRAQPGERVVVFGAGPIGLAVVVCLRYRGIEDIAVVDYSSRRLQIAAELGASTLINGAETDVWQAIGDSQGRAELYGMPVAASDAYIDAAGAGAVVRGVLDNCRFGARLVIVALHKEEVSLPVFQVMAKELDIRGSMAYPEEFPAVLEMLESGVVDVAPMVTHRFPLAEFDTALATAKQPDVAAKVLITL